MQGDHDRLGVSRPKCAAGAEVCPDPCERFTRPTNAFSKKVESHAYAVALHYMYYNFVRLHGKVRVTPAMQAGMTDRLWEISDIVALVEAADAPAKKRGPYKKTSPDSSIQ